MEQFLKIFQAQQDENKKLLDQFHKITTELAVTSTNLKNVTEQITRTNLEQKDMKEDVEGLKSNMDKAQGSLSTFRIFYGLLVLAISASFGWAYNTSSWIAKIDQWKTQVDSHMERYTKDK